MSRWDAPLRRCMMRVGPRDRAVHQDLVAGVEEPVEKRYGHYRVRAYRGEEAIRASGPTTGLWRSTHWRNCFQE